jgi:hypothetical protein
VQLFTYCLEECPRGYKLDSTVTDLCVPLDGVFEEEVYVTASGSGADKGTAEDPYLQLAMILANLYAEETTIWLLKGVHDYSYTSAYYDVLSFSGGSSVLPYKLTIAGLLCSNSDHPECADEPPTLQFEYNFASFFSMNVILRDLQISQKSRTTSTCDDPCRYCPVFTKQNGVYVTGKGEEFASVPVDCSISAYYLLLFVDCTAYFEVISTQHVTFVNIRYKPVSIINASQSSLTLKNVDFTRVQAGYFPSYENAVVYMSCLVTSSCFFRYEGGSVTFANDGYDTESVTFPSIFKLKNLKSQTFKGLDFRFNFLMDQNLVEAVMSIESPFMLTVQDCTFEYILGVGYIISVQMMDRSLSEADQDTEHMRIENLTVKHCSVIGGSLFALSYNYKTSQSNLVISGLTVEDSVLSQAAIKITYPAFIYVQNSDIFYGRTRLTNTTFRRCDAALGLLSSSELQNVEFEDLTVENCGIEQESIDSQTVKYFIANPDHYIKRNFNLPIRPCNTAYFKVTGSQSVSLTNVRFTNNKCSNTTGFAVASKAFEASRLRFEGNTIRNTETGVLDITADTCQLSEVALLSNGGPSYIGCNIYLVCSELKLHAVTAANNNSYYSNLYIAVSKVTAISDLQCSLNTAVDTACLIAEIYSDNSLLSITNSEFIANSATDSTGAVKVTQPANTNIFVTVLIDRCLFRGNRSIGGGSAFQVVPTVNSLNSFIRNSVFENNASEAYAAVDINFGLGSLTIENCIFRGNSGKINSAVDFFGECFTENCAEMVIQNSSFTDNSGMNVIYADSLIPLFAVLKTYNLLVKGNDARGVRAYSVKWIDVDSIITENASIAGAGAEISMFTEADLTGTSVTYNSHALAGGAFMLTSKARLVCRYCKLIGNFSSTSGGAIYIDKLSSLELYHSKVEDNQSSKSSAIAFVFASDSVMVNNTFINNYSTDLYLMQLQNTNLTVLNSTFANNTSLESSAIEVVSSNLTMTYCAVTNSTSDMVGFFYISSKSAVLFRHVTITHAHGLFSLGIIVLLGESSLVIEDSELRDFDVGENTGAIYVDIKR